MGHYERFDNNTYFDKLGGGTNGMKILLISLIISLKFFMNIMMQREIGKMSKTSVKLMDFPNRT